MEEMFIRKRQMVLRWPAISMDLNPSENLWKKLKSAGAERIPANFEELERKVVEEWQKLLEKR